MEDDDNVSGVWKGNAIALPAELDILCSVKYCHKFLKGVVFSERFPNKAKINRFVW